MVYKEAIYKWAVNKWAVNKVIGFGRHSLLPQCCLCCGGGAEKALCEACHIELPWITRACPHCGIGVLVGMDEDAASATPCGRCQQQPPAFDRCIAPLHYGFPVPSLIAQFKQRRRHAYGAALADLLATHVQHVLDQQALPQLIVPVPLHWWRQIRRGFNQAELVALDCGRRLGIEVDTQLLRRVQATPPQQSLSLHQRRHNLRDAFAINPAYLEKGCVKARHIALVDDVVTTMSTCDTLARLLKQYGATRVDVWAIARTPRLDEYAGRAP